MSASVGSTTITEAKTVVLENNYEEDCPPLYEAIETAKTGADFDRILTFLDTGRWEGSFFSDGSSSSPPEDQAKTWVTRFDENNRKKVKWSQLPLHLAIVCAAPPAIIGSLVRLYPQAIRCTDDQHMLPLHLCLRHGSADETVAFILLKFPEAVNAKGKNGRNAVECAQRAKDKLRGVILEVFVEQTKSRLSSSVIHERETLKAIIEEKNTDVCAIKSELEAQISVVDKLRSDLAKTQAEKAELQAESKEQSESLRSAKLVETIDHQRKVEELEAHKKELREIQRKAREDEASLRKELEAVQAKVSSSVSPDDWTSLKSEVEALKVDRLKNGRGQARDDINVLKGELEKSLGAVKMTDSRNSRSELQSELQRIQKTVDMLQTDEGTVKSSAELMSLRDEVKALRADMKSRAETSKTKLEFVALKKAMEVELRNTEGKTKGELEILRKVVNLANEMDIENKTAAELADVMADLQALKKGLTEKELDTTTKKNVEELREHLEAIMKTADPKTMVELSALKTNVDALHNQIMETQSKEEMFALKKELESLKDELKKIEISAKIHEEAAGLREIVDAELSKSQGKTRQELLHMKQMIQSIVDQGLKNKNADELTKIKGELGSVKNGLKDIEEANKTQLELAVLKKALEVQMLSANGKTERELLEMKKAVDAINLENTESKKLKKSLAEEIKQVNGKTEKELLELKKALNNINLTKLQSSDKSDWDAMRKEMESLKADLQDKQSVEMTQELLAMKKVIEAINIKDMENKNKTEFGAIRQEMDALKAELKLKEDGEEALKKAVDILKGQVHSRSALSPRTLPPRKDKVGIKKFLRNHFIRKSPSNMTSPSADMTAIDELEIEASRSPNNVETILPPSLSLSDNRLEALSSADSSCNGEERAAPISTKSKAESVLTVKAGTTAAKKETAAPLPPLPLFAKKKTNKLLALRKVMSMGPAPTPTSSLLTEVNVALSMDPTPTPTSSLTTEYNMARTFSKAVISENGEVELEAVIEADHFPTSKNAVQQSSSVA